MPAPMKPAATKAIAPTVKQAVIPMAQEPQGAASLMALISRFAADPTLDVTKLDHLLATKERWEKEEARKAFVIALNNFKADPPEVFRDKTVDFETQKGKTHYTHASLDKVSAILGAAGVKHGLSHRWETAQGTDGKITVTCILTHTGGHSERVTLSAPADTSGSKNSIQAIASTVSYLERYTVLALYGVAVQDGNDNDGKGDTRPIAGPEDPEPAEPTATEAEVVNPDPVEFVPTNVTKRGDTFTIFRGTEKRLTKEEKFAVIARDAYKEGVSVRSLDTNKGGVLWIDNLEAAGQREF